MVSRARQRAISMFVAPQGVKCAAGENFENYMQKYQFCKGKIVCFSRIFGRRRRPKIFLPVFRGDSDYLKSENLTQKSCLSLGGIVRGGGIVL